MRATHYTRFRRPASVSGIRSATSNPEAAVRSPIAAMAISMLNASASAPVHEHQGEQRDALEHHAARNEPLSPDPVGESAGAELHDAPRCRVDEREHADLAQRQSRRGEEKREEAPREAVIQVVDESCLAGAGQRQVAPAGSHEEFVIALTIPKAAPPVLAKPEPRRRVRGVRRRAKHRPIARAVSRLRRCARRGHRVAGVPRN